MSADGKIAEYLRQGEHDKAIHAAMALCEDKGPERETGIEIARAAAAVYRDLIAAPVHQFAEAAPNALPAEVGQLVHKALQRLIRQTEEWETQLWSVHTERLAREIRDWTRMKHLDAAAANVGRMMALSEANQRNRRASYIGGILGTVLNNQKEAKDLLIRLHKGSSKYYVTPEEVALMDKTREERFGKIGSMNMDALEREYSSVLTGAIVELQRKMPEPNKMEEPGEDVLRDVGDNFRAILRVPIWREEPELLLDATRILVDFIPKQQSATAKLANVEGRAYGQLGYTAKKAILLTFQDIGKNKFFTGLYKSWATEYAGTDALRDIIELMGALRSSDFNEFLKIIRADTSKTGDYKSQVSTALSSIADDAAVEDLLGQLRSILSKRRLDNSQLREAEQLIDGLGNVLKSPRTDVEDVHRIREFARTHIPEDLTRLARHSALQLFVSRRDDLSAPQTQWAIRVLVRSIWMPDETTEHHKGGERQATELGFREPLVDSLARLGPLDPSTLIHAIEPLAARYGMAFVAAAELLQRLKLKESLTVLEHMLNTTLLHDENSVSTYQQESYWDAGKQQRVTLTKNKVIGPLVYAIGTIGGERSQEILLRYKDQISSGKVPPPDSDTAGYLQRFLGDAAFSKPEVDDDAPLPAASEADLKPLMKQLNSRYMFSGKQTRRAKKIEALTRLAQFTPVEAVDVVFKHLADKDALVASAAITCLSEYASMNKPKALRDLTINTCLDMFEDKDPAMRSGAVKLLREIGPTRKDVKPKITAFAKHVEKHEAKEALAAALRSVGSDTLTQLVVAEGGDAKADDKKAPGAVDKLEAKRQYLAARKQWIASGKVGDPPPKPPGID